MTFLRNILAELVGLFVDDWVFALLVLLWVGLFSLAGGRSQAAFAGPLLFLGLAVLTLVFVTRKTKR